MNRQLPLKISTILRHYISYITYDRSKQKCRHCLKYLCNFAEQKINSLSDDFYDFAEKESEYFAVNSLEIFKILLNSLKIILSVSLSLKICQALKELALKI